jgi:hypothetical protein
MVRRAELPTSRRHVHLYDEDWEFLQQNYGPQSGSQVSVSEVIRAIVHKKVLALKAAASQAYDEIAAQRASSQIEGDS